MLTIAQIAAILGLLAAFGVGQPTIDNVATILNNQTINTMSDDPTSKPVSNTPTPEPTVQPTYAETKASQARIEILKSVPGIGAGLGRDDYTASTEPIDARNYVVVGVIVYDANGQPSNTAKVDVTATDNSQDKIMLGTGSVTSIFSPNGKREVPVYIYTYNLHTSGKHTITFKSGELTARASVDVK